jgi:hypothetical protein
MARACTGVRPPRFTVPLAVAQLAAPLTEGVAKVLQREPLYTAESLNALQANRVYVRDKAAADLGHDPRPVRESILDAYAWFAAHDRLPARVLSHARASG